MAYNDSRDRYQHQPSDAHYYQSYDHHQEPSQLPYGQADHQLPYTSSQPTHQQPYAETHSPYPQAQDHQQAYHHQDHQQAYHHHQDQQAAYHHQDQQAAYHHQDHLNYPPGSLDPYYSHQDAPPSPHPTYYNQYDDHHHSGYPLDEKTDYPPPHTAQHLVTPKASFNNQNSRGSVAAQMAAEGAIPEKAGLRMWRSDEHSGAFLRGGKGKCCGRCCCCTMIVVALLLIGIIAGFLLWVRPPNATFNGIEPPTAGNQVDLQEGGFLLNFDLNIGVTNPNFFGASFSKISAKAYYPLNKTAPLGGGEMDNVQIQSHSNTTIHFPFQINYTTTFDPKHAILADIAYKCGFLGAKKTPIKISFDITLKLKILAISISPTFSSSNTFTCPLKQSDFNSVLGGQQSMEALQQMLTGSNSAKVKRTLVFQSDGGVGEEMILKSIGFRLFNWGFMNFLDLKEDSFSFQRDGSGWKGLADKVLIILRWR
ncbi:hypothetical protein DFH28DRAFT_374464 [Melampsora americana]|nr:hypothetical protein DFH28DRAFT_374464 [Melampsora americana]